MKIYFCLLKLISIIQNYFYVHEFNVACFRQVQRFFGTVRMAGGTNDYPCTPTFLQICMLLSAYNILKPLQPGNYTTKLENDPPQSLVIISQIKDLYKKNDKGSFEEIKSKLNIVISYMNSDFSDFINAAEQDYALPELIDCLLFYTTESVYRHIRNRIKCYTCLLKAFLDTSDLVKDSLIFSCGQMPNRFEKFINPHKELMHTNIKMYILILKLDVLFRKYAKFVNVFDLILKDFTDSQIEIQFECDEHKNEALEILAYIIKFFIQIRMREF